MTLFTMAVTAILALYAVAAASHRRAIHQANARLIATRVAADLRARPPAQIQPPARENQTLSGVDPAYKYDVTFESVGGGSALRATIRVHWPSERGEEEIVIPTVISRGSP